MDDLDQLLGSFGTGIAFGEIGIDQVLANVILEDLGDEPLQGSAAGGGLLKNPRTLFVALDSALDCLNLPLDALQAIEQFRPVPFYMSHL